MAHAQSSSVPGIDQNPALLLEFCQAIQFWTPGYSDLAKLTAAKLFTFTLDNRRHHAKHLLMTRPLFRQIIIC